MAAYKSGRAVQNAENQLLDFGHNLAPIYVQLSTIFRRFIETGEWPVDARIATHEKLAVQFGVNPATVRKAIGILAKEGLLVCSRRRGTVVVARPPRQPSYTVPTTRADYRARDEAQRFDLEKARVASRRPEPFHGSPKFAASYQEIARTLRREGKVMGVETAYIAADVWAATESADRESLPVLALVERAGKGAVGAAGQTVSFGSADAVTAAGLDCRVGMPIAIVRMTVTDRKDVLRAESALRLRGECFRIDESLRDAPGQ